MFVDIDNPKSPLNVAVMLFPHKKGKEKITPEVCLNVLKSTNYQRSIKDMLNCIWALPVEEQAPFKDVVLSAFDNRECTNDVIVLGKKLAVSGGYEEEMAAIAGKIHHGEWIDSQAMAEKWTVCTDTVCGPKLDNVLFSTMEVDLRKCNLSPVKKMRFLDGAAVYLSWAKNLPQNLDVSMCSHVSFVGCDLSQVNDLKFRDGVVLDFVNAKNFPANLDVSMADFVNFGRCDLRNIKELKFRDWAEVRCWNAENLPANMDVSMCSKVDFMGSDLAGVKELKFCEGANVDLTYTDNLPNIIDVSKCLKVDLEEIDLSNVQNITFKNKKQMEKSKVEFPYNWKGQVVFVEEDDNTSKFSKFLDNFRWGDRE